MQPRNLVISPFLVKGATGVLNCLRLAGQDDADDTVDPKQWSNSDRAQKLRVQKEVSCRFPLSLPTAEACACRMVS